MRTLHHSPGIKKKYDWYPYFFYHSHIKNLENNRRKSKLTSSRIIERNCSKAKSKEAKLNGGRNKKIGDELLPLKSSQWNLWLNWQLRDRWRIIFELFLYRGHPRVWAAPSRILHIVVWDYIYLAPRILKWCPQNDVWILEFLYLYLKLYQYQP